MATGSDDLFAHYSEIDARGFRFLEEGQKVEYEVGQGQKGSQAQKIRPSDPGSRAAFRQSRKAGERGLAGHWAVGRRGRGPSPRTMGASGMPTAIRSCAPPRGTGLTQLCRRRLHALTPLPSALRDHDWLPP
ncbi:cold shock domain-containing protein [Sinomonas humi]